MVCRIVAVRTKSHSGLSPIFRLVIRWLTCLLVAVLLHTLHYCPANGIASSQMISAMHRSCLWMPFMASMPMKSVG
nr:MAG TPA: hypothetical protein [Caudoviricetes sp.]